MFGATFQPGGGGGPVFMSWGVYNGISPSAVAYNPYATTVDRIIFPKLFTLTYWVAPPNNAGNFWQLYLNRVTPPHVFFPLVTFSTNTGVYAGGSWDRQQTNVFTAPSVDPATYPLLFTSAVPVGAPGAIWIVGPLLEISS